MNDKLKPIFKSSPQAAITPIKKGMPKYPWVEVQPGYSFVINSTDMKFTTARSFASRMQKKFGKKFRVIDHGPEVGYEVACLPMTESEAVQAGGSVIDTLNKMGGKSETQKEMEAMGMKFGSDGNIIDKD